MNSSKNKTTLKEKILIILAITLILIFILSFVCSLIYNNPNLLYLSIASLIGSIITEEILIVKSDKTKHN